MLTIVNMESKKRIQVATDVPKKVRLALKKRAENEGRTLAQYVRLLLTSHAESVSGQDQKA